MNTICWDQKYEGFISSTIPIKDYNNDKPVNILQAKYCMVSCRSFPLLVIASVKGVMVIDFFLVFELLNNVLNFIH